MVLAGALDDRHLVVGRVEADLRTRDVVEDDRVDGLALELRRARGRSRRRRSRRRSRPASGRRAGGGEPGEDVLGRLQAQLRGRRRRRATSSSPSGAAAGSRPARPPSAARGRRAKRLADGGGELGGGLDRDRLDRRPAAGAPTLAAIRVTSAPRSAAARGEREAHAAAGAVADEAHRVDRLAGAAGGDQDPQAVPAARRARAASPRPRRAAARGRAAGRCRARRARRARRVSGSITTIPRSRRVARFAWVAGVGVHAVVHRRGDGARRRAGEEGGGQHRVADPGGELGDACSPRPGRRGRRRRWRRARGGRSGRAPAARRRGRRRAAGRARTRRRAPGAPTMPSNEAAPTKRPAVGVISTRTPWPALGRQARELERLVGGDAAAHAEQDPGHGLDRTPGAGAGSRARRLRAPAYRARRGSGTRSCPGRVPRGRSSGSCRSGSRPSAACTPRRCPRRGRGSSC